jgi:hypothetical protein
MLPLIKKGAIVLFGFFASAYFILSLTSNTADYDLWILLAFGRSFWRGAGLGGDAFSYIPTKSLWAARDWLSELTFYSVYSSFGPAGLQLWKYITAIATGAIAWVAAKKRGAGTPACILCLFVISYFIYPAYSPVRPTMFTNLFFVVTLAVLESTRADKKWSRLWWLVPLNVIWPNVHGAFIAGPGVIALYALVAAFMRQRPWPYVRTLACSVIATFFNPYGIKLWISILGQAAEHQYEIQEWQPVWYHLLRGSSVGACIVYVLLVVAAVLIVRFYLRKDLPAVLVLAVTALLAGSQVRHMILFALAWAVYLPLGFSRLYEGFRHGPWTFGRLNRLAAMCLLPALAVPWFGADMREALHRTFAKSVQGSVLDLITPDCGKTNRLPSYPLGALAYMRKHNLKGNILPEFSWGAFLIWTCYPQCRVAMHGRYEVAFSKEVRAEYMDFILGGENWSLFLNKYPHDIILLAQDTGACRKLKENPGWRPVYEDKGSALFVRAR